MSSQQHSQSFVDDCSLSDFDSAGLSLCNVSEMENFTGNSTLVETQTGSVEIVNVTNEGVQSASHDPTSYPSPGRFGKSTHISMISNSVTHLRRYTNSAIADIAGNSAPISL